MVNIIKVNDEWLPKPEGDLSYKDDKVKSEMESEAGTTLAIVTREYLLAIPTAVIWNRPKP